MKKRIVWLLAFAIALCLCACAQEQPGKYDHITSLLDKGDFDGAISAIQQMKPATQPTQGEEAQGPTTGQLEQLRLYNTIARALKSYDSEGVINIYNGKENLSGSEALAYCYESLNAMEDIDQWLADDKYVDPGTQLDRQKLIKGFDIEKDVVLKQSQTVTDNLGNVSTNSRQVMWHYNGDGTLERIEGAYSLPEFERFDFSLGTVFYMYDIDGSVMKLQFGSSSYVAAVLTPTYDENGRVVSEYVQTNDRDYLYTYTYDAAGRVEKITWRHSNDQMASLVYTYNEAGQVTKTVQETVLDSNSLPVLTWTREYTYDGQGNLASAVYTETGWGHADGKAYVYQQRVDKAEFWCDDQGRVVKQTITPGVLTFHDGTESKPDYTSQVLEKTYGNYYHYNPLV